MSQDNTAELMTAYLDDELDEAQAEHVRSLLESSPEVAEEMDGLQSLLAVVATLPEVEAPPDFYEGVDRKLRRRKLWSGETLASGLVSMPFQVVSIIVIIAVAAGYMLLQLDQDQVRIEKDEAPIGSELEGDERPGARDPADASPAE